ncbi:unnamed protein product, partial [Discosporangium mesarthrocarpum]
LLSKVAAVLRNLAVDKVHTQRFLGVGAASSLCSLLIPFSGHHEVVLNTARVLAKLSLHESVRRELNADPNNTRDLLATLVDQGQGLGPTHGPRNAQRLATCVRVAFALGNLTSTNDDNRKLVGIRFGGIFTLPRLLRTAADLYLSALRQLSPSLCATHDSLEEVLVKTVRLMANIGINHDVGRQLGLCPEVAVLEPLLRIPCPGEELLLNVVSLVTNLSFYGRGGGWGCPTGGDVARLLSRRHPGGSSLCRHLVKVLLHPNEEAVTEAARAFGNFSRDGDARCAMGRHRADEVLVVLLGHPSRDVVFAVVGALVNLAADKRHKSLLWGQELRAGEQLGRLVRRAGLADVGMATIACQALHNLLLEPLPPGGADEVVGGLESRERLWWTLHELLCAAGAGEEGEGAYEHFVAAASAVQRAL